MRVQYNGPRMSTQLTQRGREAMALYEAGASPEEIAAHLFGDLRRVIDGEGAAPVAPEPESSDPARDRPLAGTLGVIFAAFGTAVLVVLALTLTADALR